MSDHKEFLFPITVYWEDTDAGGVVYHANYLRFMERARSESLKSLGCFQTEMARENRAQLVVVSVSIRYRRPALLEDKLVVHSRIVGLKRASVVIEQTVMRGDTVLTEGVVRVACVSTDTKAPCAFPEALYQAMQGELTEPEISKREGI